MKPPKIHSLSPSRQHFRCNLEDDVPGHFGGISDSMLVFEEKNTTTCAKKKRVRTMCWVSQSGIVEECEGFMSGCNNELGSPDYLLDGGEIIKPVIESHELIRTFDKTVHGTLCQQTSSENLWILQ